MLSFNNKLIVSNLNKDKVNFNNINKVGISY
jgi:hypothetical protein